MSAWIVSRSHIDYLLKSALQLSRGSGFTWYHKGARQELTHENADQIGAMLWKENHRSINARFPRDRALTPIYKLSTGVLVRVDPVQVLKSVDCYEYQTCEHKGWQNSNARAFCLALTNTAINSLPGYNDAEWGPPKEQPTAFTVAEAAERAKLN